MKTNFFIVTAFPIDLGRKIAQCCTKHEDRTQLERGNLYCGTVSNQSTCLSIQTIDRCTRSLDSFLTQMCRFFQ